MRLILIFHSLHNLYSEAETRHFAALLEFAIIDCQQAVWEGQVCLSLDVFGVFVYQKPVAICI